jgi:DNA-binding MarR family transcriptional regulator
MAGECLGVRLRLVDRVVTGIYNDALRPHGLRATQMNVLGAIALVGPTGPDRIGRILRISPSTLSRTIDRMKGQGWLSTHPGTDARRLTLELTPEGAKILGKARSGWRKAQERVATLLGSDGVAAVHAIADRLSTMDEEEDHNEA